ncbi:MAG: NADH-quinone oxidoreductase subunit L [Armatimonadetes bacterium]|nr:NADH-quinone oxidoreductase subunit L [Armatimonadota bacterium]MDW8028866.1 NADH-quinone oxidoreductase subunit L [Armatimonadota bacterium]
MINEGASQNPCSKLADEKICNYERLTNRNQQKGWVDMAEAHGEVTWSVLKGSVEEWSAVLLVLAFPLVGFIINGMWGRRLPKPLVGFVACSAIFGAFVASLYLLVMNLSLPPLQRSMQVDVYSWLEAGPIKIPFALLLDPLSIAMALTVSGVSFLIHVYSVGYMAHDEEFSRYFALLNLFVFFMLLLVLAGNLATMFIGWEGVGLCSFQLISFWFTRERAAEAGRKAFIVTRFGDFGFLVATLGLLAIFGTLDFGDIAMAIQRNEIVKPWWGDKVHAIDALNKPTVIGLTLGTLICLGLFMGAIGKSAQFPLYVWLPDAMEGPTPVSALIHAATMVTAGVYMVARLHFLFEQAPIALTVVAIIGAFTAAYAATMGCVENDIKRVLAYSTISQLGYMFLACGLGAYIAGFYHLITHAFFKALLFLCAGSVMHAMHDVLDIRKMGGLVKKMPITALTFWIGGLALAGLIPSGLFSKDAILHAAESQKALWALGLFTAVLTAFYTTRLGIKVFHGKPRDEHLHEHAHESPDKMTIPMILLAFGTLAVSVLWLPSFVAKDWTVLPQYLQPVLGEIHEPSAQEALKSTIWAVGAASLGLIVSLFAYSLRPGALWAFAKALPFLYRLVAGKYFIDEIYAALITRPGRKLSEFVSAHFDLGIIDATVNGVGWLTSQIGLAVRRMQTGFIRNYALYFVGASVLLLFYMLFRGIMMTR